MDGIRPRLIRIPYTSVREGKRFFEPRGRMLEHGFTPRALGDDTEGCRRVAWRLYEEWVSVRDGRAARREPAPTKEGRSIATSYPSGSIGAAWQVWIETEEWKRLASSNRNKIWWPAWLKRIEPVFGDIDPNTITMGDLSEWRQRIEDVSGVDVAHKALKTWRALWRVMQALRYTQLTDPSQKVVNPQPTPRSERFSHGEAMRMVKAAWRQGYRGLACISVVAWDTGFAPVDARTLRRRHILIDEKTGRFVFDRSKEGRRKTGVPVIGTLSRFGDWLVRRYLEEFGAQHTPESVLFRTRTGVAYAESRLGNDFALVRAVAEPGDKRQLRDMRRSGVMEAFVGGAEARDVAEKFGNSIDRSSRLFKTYNPVDVEKVKQTDVLRLEGRRRRNKK